MPVALVAVNGNVFARVGLQEDDRSIFLYGSRARADRVKIIEEPGERSVVVACASLYCLVWLFLGISATEPQWG